MLFKYHVFFENEEYNPQDEEQPYIISERGLVVGKSFNDVVETLKQYYGNITEFRFVPADDLIVYEELFEKNFWE